MANDPWVEDTTYLSRCWDVDEAVDVNIDKGSHEELTVKPVHDATVTGDDVTEVLDLECSLESRSKEATERSNNRGKERHEETVNEERVESDCFLHVQKPPPCGECLWQRVLCWSEESTGLTHHGHPLQLGTVLDGTHQVGNIDHGVGQTQAHEHCGDATANKSLPGLLWAQLDERSPSHEEAPHVGHDIVDDHHHDGHDEPDEALEHILYDEIGLGDHTQQSNVGPGEQRELPQIIFLDQRQNKPDESHDVHREGDESVVLDQNGKKVNLVNDNSKLLDQGLSVEEIV